MTFGLSSDVGRAVVGFLAWCCDAVGYREKVRRAREAPLVALVNAVPEGLDPIGWRVAVLAACEHCPEMVGADAARKLAAAVQRHIAGGTKPDAGSVVACAVDAYRRAIAPRGPRPVPYRRKAPGLPVDDGRDE